MTDRPRRSRPTKKQGPTIDLEAEKKANVTNNPKDPSAADPLGDDFKATVISSQSADAAPAEPVKGRVAWANEAGEASSQASASAARSNWTPSERSDETLESDTASRDEFGTTAREPDTAEGGDSSLPLGATPANVSTEESSVSRSDDWLGASTDTSDTSTARNGDQSFGLSGSSKKAGDDAGRDATSAFASDKGLDGSPLEESERESEKERATILSAATPSAGTTGGSYPSTASGDGDAFAAAVHGSGDRGGRHGGGFGKALTAAILGAIIALGGAAALQYAGVLPAAAPEAGETQQLAAGGDDEQISGELAALQAEVDELRAAQGAAGPAEGAGTADIAALGERLTAVEQAAQGAGAAGEAATAAQGAADQANTAAASAQETATAAAQAAEAARTEAAAAAAAAAQALTAGTTAETTATAAQQAATEAQQVAAAAQEGATQALTAANAAQATATQSAETLQGFEQRLAAIETANSQAATALAAANLKSAIDRGGPFMGQLESYAAASGSPEAVETLREYAADGVPSAADLRAAWPDVQDRILAALAPVPADAPVSEQVLSGLRSLVTVRPAGPAPETAEGPQAAVSRLDAAVESGDFAAWLAEWQSLPQAAKGTSQPFASRVEARVAAGRIVDQALDGAIQPAAAGNQG